MTETYRAYRVEARGDRYHGGVKTLHAAELPPGDVTIRVAYSSLNYKDALSASGHRGVTRSYPHTPGIDAAEFVSASSDQRFAVGDEVIVTGFDLGMNTPGGFGGLICVPADWVVPLPPGLELREAMILGTAGLTAGLCVDALQRCGIETDGGPVLVTGASGGVGSLAVALLAKLGYEVVASTGTPGAHELLTALGASHLIDRSELSAVSDRPLLKGVYAGAVDTVGGHTMESIVKSLRWGGAVAACGLVGGVDLDLTVYPFILRAARLLGVDSVECPMPLRQRIWNKLAGEWKPEWLERLATEVTLEGLSTSIDAMLRGETVGRLVVTLEGESSSRDV
ncbi:MAG: YhdH/YhfP family quinone oxidoreductase [Trueperaceae bacterium]|nr:MAG: YhdH/YhfP family quinone oxidoreductase [Trueperaceae bacterium]